MVDTSLELPRNRDPYQLPVTEETWLTLDREVVRFYAARGTAPTELAARLLAKAYSRVKGRYRPARPGYVGRPRQWPAIPRRPQPQVTLRITPRPFEGVERAGRSRPEVVGL